MCITLFYVCTLQLKIKCFFCDENGKPFFNVGGMNTLE